MNDDALPETTSRYQVITKLGQGGMAQVLLVLARGRAGVNKLLVVKELLAELREDPEFVAMFLDEAGLAVRLNHPNVIQTYEVDDSRAHPSIVMEYLEGQSLSALINRVGRAKMPLDLHLYILAQAAAGLHHAHDLCDFDGTPLGVVHRDVSPHNIFVTYDGQVKVVDFGIAKVANSARKTAIGVFKGKVNYASAEQILGEPVDRRSDCFTLGILLWEALARQRLSFREPEGEVMQRRLKGLDPAIQSVAPETPDELARICDKALQRLVTDRFESAEAFRVALETHLETSKRVGSRELGELIRGAFAQERAEIRRQIDARMKTLAQPGAMATLPTEPLAEGQSEVSSKGTSARLSLSVETELTPLPRPAAPRRT
ncbi:MAG: serine/threonine protein kinase, partial [Myxococcales bacterium]